MKKGVLLLLFCAATGLLRGQSGECADTSAMVAAFFGLDNGIRGLCGLGPQARDGIPVQFQDPVDGSTLQASDFELVGPGGEILQPLCAQLAPADEPLENRTVLLLGEFGDGQTQLPQEIRVTGELWTLGPSDAARGSCEPAYNLSGACTREIIPLTEGPRLFFAQQIDPAASECPAGTEQVVQVAWDGGVTPANPGEAEADLSAYYTIRVDGPGAPRSVTPASITDLNDNDNYHQLCLNTERDARHVLFAPGMVEDPNGDANPFTEIRLTYCGAFATAVREPAGPAAPLYPNPASDFVQIRDSAPVFEWLLHRPDGRLMARGNGARVNMRGMAPGLYWLRVRVEGGVKVYRVVKE